jgi:hypothetical protein
MKQNKLMKRLRSYQNPKSNLKLRRKKIKEPDRLKIIQANKIFYDDSNHENFFMK